MRQPGLQVPAGARNIAAQCQHKHQQPLGCAHTQPTCMLLKPNWGELKQV
jgi:hypothetical protein